MHTDFRFAIAMVLLAAGAATPALGQDDGSGDDPYDHLPDTISLTGTVRDFRERQLPGGHPDMELRPTAGYGHYVGMVAEQLDSEGRPRFLSTGHKVLKSWLDAEGRPIPPTRNYIAKRPGDVEGIAEWRSGGACTSERRFAEWYRDTPGVNMSAAIPITLARQPGTRMYVFDDKLDSQYADLGGFFIVNDRLFGNSQGGNKNYHFTYELQAEFLYVEGSGQRFTFRGDDDVWVFVDGRLVIDLGGVHSVVEQTIDLDRLEWLEDGKMYPLNFFYAERNRPDANFRIEVSIELRDINVPTVSALHD